MRHALRLLLAAQMLSVSMTGCAMAQNQPSIGQATMLADGTLTMRLRAEGGGALGDAMLTFPPSDPKYQSMLDHVGGLKPGESKPVPPFK